MVCDEESLKEGCGNRNRGEKTDVKEFGGEILSRY